MKKIIIILLLAGIAAFTQSCKILCGKYCRNYQIEQVAVDSISKVTNESIAVTTNELTSFITEKIVPFYNYTTNTGIIQVIHEFFGIRVYWIKMLRLLTILNNCCIFASLF